MKDAKNSQGITWQHIALTVLCVVLALILFAIVGLTIYANHLLGLITDNGDGYLNATMSPEDLATFGDDYDGTPITGPSIDHSDVVQSTVPSTPKEDLPEGVINILLIGEDRRPYETTRQRSDSMILCSINTKKNTITMVSFLRDIYISNIPGYNRPQKLNAAYAMGGAACLKQTLAAYFGVHVDATVAVDFNGFIQIIDMLGGVNIELTKAEAKHLNDTRYADIYGDDLQTVYAGTNHLNGKTALAYSRIRKLDWDGKRTERQRNVITALINAYKSKGVAEMAILASDILSTGFIKTDMTQEQVIDYVWAIAPMLSTATISSQYIPLDDTSTDANVGNIVDCKVIDLEVNRRFLKTILQ